MLYKMLLSVMIHTFLIASIIESAYVFCFNVMATTKKKQTNTFPNIFAENFHMIHYEQQQFVQKL